MGGSIKLKITDLHRNKMLVILSFILMIMISIIVATPMYYLLVTTFKTATEAALSPLSLPKSFDFSIYADAFNKMQYPRAFKNTFLITVLSVTGSSFVPQWVDMCLTVKGIAELLK